MLDRFCQKGKNTYPDGKQDRRAIYWRGFLLVTLTILSSPVFGQAQGDTLSSVALKRLSVEELMNIEVTSVSMRPEKLTEVASAVQVVTGEEIHRSGVTRLPEALRLVSNLQIAQANSHDWAITARGFNGLPSAGGILANKLLVMIDGRSIYNPLLGGVYWDVQNVLTEDLDRIEVVSGPGGTLWGANAVNGVINIVTKSAKETQGLYASAAAGSFLKDMGQLRYGFKAGPNLFFRVYGQRFDQRKTLLSNEKGAKDVWSMSQGGFRMDYAPTTGTSLTVQGDLYGGTENDSVTLAKTDGQNVLARFNHAFSEKSSLAIQFYFDRTWRKQPNSASGFSYNLLTYDLDIQHRFALGNRQSILWGGAYRFQRDKTANSFVPLSRDMPLVSGFIQDEIELAPGKLKLTIGSKFLHNVFSGFEIQPSGRLAWTPNQHHTIWTALSRSVRTPTRFDSDIGINAKKFDSEKLVALEAGYRIRPVPQLSMSFAVFFNTYDHLRSLDSAKSPLPPIVLANSQRAQSWGFEFSANYAINDRWRLRGGYTYFDKSIWAVSPHVLPISKGFEGVDTKSQCMLQSILDLSAGFQLDVVSRYIGELPSMAASSPMVPAYFTFDMRLAWTFKSFEISLVGQNLVDDNHTEVGFSRIPRTLYGKLTWRI